jgi:hypothetical protein
MQAYFGEIWLVRIAFQRGLAAIYLIAFLNALHQFRPLLGDKGLLPVSDYLRHVKFREAPSIFHFHYSDRFLALVAAAGVALSLVALLGLSEAGPLWLSITIWLLLWAPRASARRWGSCLARLRASKHAPAAVLAGACTFLSTGRVPFRHGVAVRREPTAWSFTSELSVLARD